MSQSVPLSDLQGGASAAKFEQIGDKHIGVIVSIDPDRAQTDPKTGVIKTFADGTPRKQLVITIQPETGDAVSLWAKGGNFTVASGSGESMQNAIGTAVRAAGANSLDVGAKLGVAHTGLGTAAAGMNPAKLYTAQYEPPTAKPTSVDVGDLFTS